jgi:hypothetical protein
MDERERLLMNLDCRCDERTDVRGSPAARIQRLLRQPLDPAEPLPLRGILLAMEVRGMLAQVHSMTISGAQV